MRHRFREPHCEQILGMISKESHTDIDGTYHMCYSGGRSCFHCSMSDGLLCVFSRVESQGQEVASQLIQVHNWGQWRNEFESSYDQLQNRFAFKGRRVIS